MPPFVTPRGRNRATIHHFGLELDYLHPLRIFAVLLIDLRMPLFAFIAGYVYGLRPIRARDYPAFALDKLRRLVVPAGIAILIFVLIANVKGNTNFCRSGQGHLAGLRLSLCPFLVPAGDSADLPDPWRDRDGDRPKQDIARPASGTVAQAATPERTRRALPKLTDKGIREKRPAGRRNAKAA